MPKSQAATVTDALRRYDVLVAEHQVQGRLVSQLSATDSLRRRQVATLWQAADSAGRAARLSGQRLAVAQQRGLLWQGRARRRGWLVAGLSAVIGSFVYLNLSR